MCHDPPLPAHTCGGSRLSLDETFKDEDTGDTCLSFNRQHWPHGDFGNAKPHSMLFVAADEDIKD